MDRSWLLSCFRRGLIPGPEESEELFRARVASRSDSHTRDWEPVASKLMASWGCIPRWASVRYEAEGLRRWEGGVTWIEPPLPPRVQLSPKLQIGSLWGTRLEEVLLHEVVHVVREAFHEPVFEEDLAYLSSPIVWKRWVGPWCARPWQWGTGVIGCMLLPWMPEIGLGGCIVSMAPWLYRRYGMLRACRRFSLQVLLCLTDRELSSGTLSFTTPQSPREHLISALASLQKGSPEPSDIS